MDATNHLSAADRVFEHVRTGVLTRRYADNDLLSEGQIAQETGVSRTPVREALLRLESQGMIRLLPKRGALVLPVTAQEADVAVVLKQSEGDSWQVSLRSKGPIDVAAAASALGGGGHVRAAGFTHHGDPLLAIDALRAVLDR